jgi:hypothetical protein
MLFTMNYWHFANVKQSYGAVGSGGAVIQLSWIMMVRLDSWAVQMIWRFPIAEHLLAK